MPRSPHEVGRWAFEDAV